MPFDQTLDVHGHVFWSARPALGSALAAARDFEEAHTRLGHQKLSSIDRLSIDVGHLQARLHELAQKIDAIEPLMQGDGQDTGRETLSSIQQQIGQELVAISATRLNLRTLARYIPAAQLDPITFAELLPLLDGRGPDMDYLLHGLSIGWRCADIQLAHTQQWPAWAMECGPSHAEAAPVFRRASVKVDAYIQSLGLSV